MAVRLLSRNSSLLPYSSMKSIQMDMQGDYGRRSPINTGSMKHPYYSETDRTKLYLSFPEHCLTKERIVSWRHRHFHNTLTIRKSKALKPGKFHQLMGIMIWTAF